MTAFVEAQMLIDAQALMEALGMAMCGKISGWENGL
jgi:hypothetical protein